MPDRERTRSLLWGATGALAFLVLAQGSRLLAPAADLPGLLVLLALAVPVGAAAGLLAHYAGPRARRLSGR